MQHRLHVLLSCGCVCVCSHTLGAEIEEGWVGSVVAGGWFTTVADGGGGIANCSFWGGM